MQAELSPTGRAILNHLRADAVACRKVSHWDPGWIERKLGLSSFEMYVACKELESLGLVELFDLTAIAPHIVLHQKLSDICITHPGLMGDYQFGRHPDAGVSD